MGCGFSKKSGKVAAECAPVSFLATYQIHPKYVYSDKHFLWVDKLDSVANLPPPHPPPTPRDAIFNPSDYSDVDARADKAPEKLLKQPYSDLVKYLTKDCSGSLPKVRAIYRWLTSIHVEQIMVPKSQPDQNTPMFQLWRIKNHKGNYAQMVSILCRLCNVVCVIINGKLKGSTYDVGQKLDDKLHCGQWNAVLIDDHWRLLNSYWGACAVGSEGGDKWLGEADDISEEGTNQRSHFVYTCDENYFLTDPRQLISTHLPFTPAWQLREEIITADRFEEMVFLKDRFFDLGLSVLSHPECVITSEYGEEEIFFQLPHQSGMYHKFYCLLFRQETKGVPGFSPKYDRYVFMHRPKPDVLSIKVRSPVAGIFRLELVGKDCRIKSPGYEYDWIAIYKILFKRPKVRCVPFPDPPDIGWGPGMEIDATGLTPVSHPLGFIHADANGETDIMFAVTDKEKVNKLKFNSTLSKGGAKEQKLKDRVVHRYVDNKVIFSVKLPKKGEYSLCLTAIPSNSDSTENEVNFCNYMIDSSQKKSRPSYPRGFEGKVGQKSGCETLGLVPLSHPSGMIFTETDEVQISFQMNQPIDYSVSLVGSEIMASDAKRLLTECVEDNVVTYTVKLPKHGNYGLRFIGKPKEGETFESLVDYVIEYKMVENAFSNLSSPLTPQIIRLKVSSATTTMSSPIEEDTRAGIFDNRITLAAEAEDEPELLKTIAELKKVAKTAPSQVEKDTVKQNGVAINITGNVVTISDSSSINPGLNSIPSPDATSNKDAVDHKSEMTSDSRNGVVSARDTTSNGGDHSQRSTMTSEPKHDSLSAPETGDGDADTQRSMMTSQPKHDALSAPETGDGDADTQRSMMTSQPKHDTLSAPETGDEDADTQRSMMTSQPKHDTLSAPETGDGEADTQRSMMTSEPRLGVFSAQETDSNGGFDNQSSEITSEQAVFELKRAQRELEIIQMRKELTESINSRDLKRLTSIANHVKEKEYGSFMEAELKLAKKLMERLRHIQRLWHDVKQLDQGTIAELKGYASPPQAVHRVLMATFLLLGNFTDETEDWIKVQVLMGKTGKESFKRRVEEFNINNVGLDIALGARHLLHGITLEEMRIVSAGATAFFVWNMGIINEIQTRHGEEIHKVRPRTKNSKRNRRPKTKMSNPINPYV